jgi:hypothetical protein
MTNGDMTPRQPDDQEPLAQLFGELFDLVDETVERVTDDDVEEHLRRVLGQTGYGSPGTPELSCPDNPKALAYQPGWGDAAAAAIVDGAHRRAAMITMTAQLKAEACNDEAQSARRFAAAAHRRAEQIIADAEEEADAALKRAAKMVADARGQAEQIISDAHQEAERIVWAARNRGMEVASCRDRTSSPALVSSLAWRSGADEILRFFHGSSDTGNSPGAISQLHQLADQPIRQEWDSFCRYVATTMVSCLMPGADQVMLLFFCSYAKAPERTQRTVPRHATCVRRSQWAAAEPAHDGTFGAVEIWQGSPGAM